jgi:hypothetical protein
MELFLSTLFSYRDQSKFHVHEFVVMPNHVICSSHHNRE